MSSIKPVNRLFALVDCNNFYVSCERVFNPRLHNKPVVVLSNNDGCVIARSNESKALGIPMGAPCFQYKNVFEQHNIILLSSNYTLYGQMSQRVMQTIEMFANELEVYSIDEAFLALVNSPSISREVMAIKETVYQWTGIPVSIGVSTTKTLAKVANRYAKKHRPKQGVFIMDKASSQEEVLRSFPVEDIWGIGSQISSLLYKNGIRTAWELASIDDQWIKKKLSVTCLRTVWELRGISCLSLEEAPPPKKSIVCSKSFGEEIYDEVELSEALSSYVASAAEKLRNQRGVATFLSVFINTNRFDTEHSYANSIHITLPVASDYTPHLIANAKCGLNKIFRNGFAYKKVGIMLGGIVSKRVLQHDLFAENKGSGPKQNTLMQLIDRMNNKYGRDTLKFGSQGTSQRWKMKQKNCTKRFTTSWDDLLVIEL